MNLEKTEGIEEVVKDEDITFFIGRKGKQLFQILTKGGEILEEKRFQAQYEPPRNPQEMANYLNTQEHDLLVEEIQKEYRN